MYLVRYQPWKDHNPVTEFESAKYDRLLSQHMLQVHEIKDSIALHGENIRNLSKYEIPPVTIVDGCERIQCDECKTTFGKSCPHDYRQHKSKMQNLKSGYSTLCFRLS